MKHCKVCGGLCLIDCYIKQGVCSCRCLQEYRLEKRNESKEKRKLFAKALDKFHSDVENYFRYKSDGQGYCKTSNKLNRTLMDYYGHVPKD